MAQEDATRDMKGQTGASATADQRRAKPKGRPRREGLDSLQRRGISARLTYPTQAAAAAAIGVSEKTFQRWFQLREFRDEYFRQLDELLAEQWSMMAAARKEIWGRFMELVRSKNETVALRAATWYFDHMARRMPSLQLRQDNDDDGVELPPKLRELYERLEDPGAESEDGDAT
jgi:hypothetical protein